MSVGHNSSLTKITDIFLISRENICYRYSLEVPHSLEVP